MAVPLCGWPGGWRLKTLRGAQEQALHLHSVWWFLLLRQPPSREQNEPKDSILWKNLQEHKHLIFHTIYWLWLVRHMTKINIFKYIWVLGSNTLDNYLLKQENKRKTEGLTPGRWSSEAECWFIEISLIWSDRDGNSPNSNRGSGRFVLGAGHMCRVTALAPV